MKKRGIKQIIDQAKIKGSGGDGVPHIRDYIALQS